VKISEKKTKCPDIQIWLNRQAGQGFCGWELKTPEREHVSRVHRLKTYESLYNIAQADDLQVASHREALKRQAREILNGLATLHREGHLHLVYEGVKNLWPHIDQSLSNRVDRDSAFRNDLYNWAAKQGIANFEEASFLESVSRQIVYRLLGRIRRDKGL